MEAGEKYSYSTEHLLAFPMMSGFTVTCPSTVTINFLIVRSLSKGSLVYLSTHCTFMFPVVIFHAKILHVTSKFSLENPIKYGIKSKNR